MQEIIFEFTLVISISFLIGLGSSMVGIAGGVFKTPVLIIIFGLTAQFSTVISLFSAIFVAVPSSIRYFKNEKKPTMVKVGLLIAILAVPGLFIGVFLKSMIVDDYLLRAIFGVSLFPVAVMMLLTKRSSDKTDNSCEISEYNIGSNSYLRLFLASVGFFVTGIASSMLGLGGGALFVPIMCLILGTPMLVAAATSMFVMLFTSTAGTLMNFVIIPQTADISSFLFYSTALGVGLVVGAAIGSDYACEVDGVLLKRFFGVILVYPLIRLIRLGQLWLDPSGTNLLLCTIGDIIIWMLIVLPCAIIWIYWRRKRKTQNNITNQLLTKQRIHSAS